MGAPRGFHRAVGLRSSDVVAAMRLIAEQSKTPVVFEGTVVPDSYLAAQGTVDVLVGETAGYGDSDPSQGPLIFTEIPLSVPSYGFQHGPLGGERVTIKTAGGADWRASFDYDEDDSPGAPAGETWIVKRTAGLENLTPNASIKLTNDGPAQGDGLGGMVGVGNGLVQHSTASGVTHILDDVQQEASSIAPKVSLGARFADLPVDAAAIAKTHIETLGHTVDLNRLSDMLLLAKTMVAAGIPNAAQLVQLVEAFLIQTIGATAIPSGSSIVRLLS